MNYWPAATQTCGPMLNFERIQQVEEYPLSDHKQEKSFRVIDRRPFTCTDLMRLPTTSPSRSRRMVSTSGSSGTLAVPPTSGGVGDPLDSADRVRVGRAGW